MYYDNRSDDDGWGGVLICIVVILIFVMLFRGLRGRQECVIYTNEQGSAGAPQVISYTEKKENDNQIQDVRPAHAAVGAPFSLL